AQGGHMTDVAAGILEEAASESPRVPRRVVTITKGYRFEQSAVAALRRLTRSVVVGHEVVDVVVNGTIAVDTRYIRGGIVEPGFLLESIDRLASRLFGPVGTVDGLEYLLVVTNTDVPQWMEIGEGSSHQRRVRVVTWTPELGDEPLAQALEYLL
ncbi:hypothetical protein ACFT1B_33630, partial [Streptomyces griseoincarnatus]